MVKILSWLPDKIIQFSFYLLLFLTPLILTPFNYELFEYNKMMVTYALTAIIIGSWLIKMALNKEIKIARTLLDIPLILFLISQIISTIFSIDRHVSIWGYYSRFNGGLLSTVSYVLLYYAFVSNFPKEKIFRLLFIVLSSGFLVSIYGILEHFGIDKDIWVQDVQNRVFSTLGQPNWLAAYLAVLIPIAIGLAISNIKNKISNTQIKYQKYLIFAMYFLSFIFYICLLFTKSRSGFLGFWISLIVFWLISTLPIILNKLLSQKQTHMQATAYMCYRINKLIGIFIISFIAITFFLGSPLPQINRFTLPTLNKSTNQLQSQAPTKPTGGSIIDVGITESGTIRRIVWKGAIDIFKNFPLTGSGVETFAFAYYKFHPIEHNMTSEWDFLYNKAHNEYLNYAATTGILGIGSYLLIIGVFIWWNVKNIKYQISNIKYTNKKLNIQNGQFTISNLQLAIFASWLSILITNFFGFSVVIIQLFFFLIPAISFVLNEDLKPIYLYKLNNATLRQNSKQTMKQSNNPTINNYQKTIIILIISFIFYLLSFIAKLWYADVIFANGYHLVRSNEYTASYQALKKAIDLNDKEPLYYDEFSLPAAQLALALYDEKDAAISSQLQEEAVAASDLAVSISPNNVNFWKTRTRILFALSPFDDQYLSLAVASLEKAKLLAPTDPKIHYNLSLLYDKIGKKEESITELIETTKLKPDYRDAYFALALFYEKDKQKEKAKEALQYILTKIATADSETKRKLEELK